MLIRMLELFALTTILIAIILLIILTVIDFRTYLLPNIYVFPFGALGVAFHFLTDFHYLSLTGLFIGGIIGYGILFLIRAAGNRYYGQDSLGLGDVKLLGAAGLWLGAENTLFAMTIGAFFGLLHGLLVATYNKLKTKEPFTIARLIIPAGPGFIAGIICVGGWMYQDFFIRLLS